MRTTKPSIFIVFISSNYQLPSFWWIFHSFVFSYLENSLFVFQDYWQQLLILELWYEFEVVKLNYL